MSFSIVCYGEMLWDLLPSGPSPGGAPLNVALHLLQQGLQPQLVSRVGDDGPGRELRRFAGQQGLDLGFVQPDAAQPTGTVRVQVGNWQEVGYDIVAPVAWDFIEYTEELGSLAAAADVLVYGSLAARSEGSFATLQRLLPLSRLPVLDVNLRPPHYARERLEWLLQRARVVKLNHHELREISDWYAPGLDEAAGMRNLLARFGWQLLVVTRGEHGAAALTDDGLLVEQAGFPVVVQDTIGSGDAFLATLLRHWLQAADVQEALRRACAVGALVATYHGATPPITQAEVDRMLAG
ncbi:carbohydrate kinase [Hymenobacter sp. B81]|uniref:carbohydrate kinase n=1 Tax=Hymenobacter sp. B81 TaxID=3344878 RepID=UPI0037DD866F